MMKTIVSNEKCILAHNRNHLRCPLMLILFRIPVHTLPGHSTNHSFSLFRSLSPSIIWYVHFPLRPILLIQSRVIWKWNANNECRQHQKHVCKLLFFIHWIFFGLMLWIVAMVNATIYNRNKLFASTIQINECLTAAFNGTIFRLLYSWRND